MFRSDGSGLVLYCCVSFFWIIAPLFELALYKGWGNYPDNPVVASYCMGNLGSFSLPTRSKSANEQLRSISATTMSR